MVRKRHANASSSRNVNKGFTLIELMVVIVIIGILATIGLISFLNAQKRAKVAGVKANMHAVQTMLEIYAGRWGGVYPASFTQLNNDATTGGQVYWSDFDNPFTTFSGNGESYADESTAPLKIGIVSYEPIIQSGLHPTLYFIYGYEDVGIHIQEKGKDFYLSNG